ncbi:MAG: TonB-dependent receptor [Prevotellaceae bacterium]|jgi:TonB-linked SusC/RagA family outer membrane protein|nr:TonB-dependent receptor [Prevotellaceae bacterium]
MKQQRLFLLLLSFLLTSYCFAQQNISVSGTVRSEEDKGVIPGVSVLVKGSTLSTITNADGKYSILVNEGSTLIFSYVGAQTREVEANRAIIDVFLTSNIDLDEVVVIGYGTVRRKDMSGSVGQIKTDEMLKGNPSSSINQALQGRLAGVIVNQNDGAPGGGVSITIRGTNSFSTNTQPLYILDGIPYDLAAAPSSGSIFDSNHQTANALANINPNDIESIEVLKDASATAIYGSRGANGVVMITTKRGRKGEDKIEFSYNVSISNTGKRVEVLDPVTYARYQRETVANRATYDNVQQDFPFRGEWTYRYQGDTRLNDTGVYLPAPEDFNRPGWYTDEYGNRTFVSSTDWQKEIFQTGISHEYNLGLSGGGDKGWYNISGNYLNQTGIILNSGYSRYSLRSNMGRNLRSWLEAGLNINYTHSETNFSKTNSSESAVIRSALLFPPTVDRNFGAIEQNELNWLATNPYSYVNNAKDKLLSNNTFGAAYVNVKFVNYLSFKQNLGLNYSNNNRYTYYNRNTREGQDKKGVGFQGDDWYTGLTSESILTFDKTFGGEHSLNAVVGFTYELSNYGRKSMSASNFPTDITEAYDMSQALDVDPLSSGRGQSSLASLLGRVNYSWRGKYIATVSVRRDGSSKFAEGNKFAVFPSGALAWRLSDEEFVKNLNMFNDLKLRVSWGKTGNQGINDYQTMAYLGTANYPVGSALNSGFSELDWRGALNPDLKWETTTQTNIGMDLSILHGRINLTADLYFKKTIDLLQNVKIESNSGFGSMWKNSGWIKNSGLELSGKFIPILKAGFSWDIAANISFNRNEIGGLGGDQFATRLWYAVDNVFIQRNGLPIGAIYGYVEDGFYDNVAEVRADPQYASETKYSDAMALSKVGEIKFRDLDGDNEITEKDQTIIGNTNPDFVFGISNNLKWKNFTLGVFIQGSYGNDIFNANLIEIKMTNVGNITSDIYNSRWTPENTANAKWPKPISGGYTREWRLSDRYIENGSYIRLKNINLGYTFKKPFSFMGDIDLYISASNLLTITNYSWYDPDVNAFAGDASRRGVDMYSYPSGKTYSMGIKLNF